MTGNNGIDDERTQIMLMIVWRMAALYELFIALNLLHAQRMMNSSPSPIYAVNVHILYEPIIRIEKKPQRYLSPSRKATPNPAPHLNPSPQTKAASPSAPASASTSPPSPASTPPASPQPACPRFLSLQTDSRSSSRRAGPSSRRGSRR